MPGYQLAKGQHVVMTLSFVSAISCLAVMMQNAKSVSCFQNDTRWNLAISFTIAVIVLFAINMKRIVLAKLGHYRVVGMLYNLTEVTIKWPLDYSLRFLGILAHVTALVTSIWWLADLGGVDCGAGHGTLEATSWVAFCSFFGLFVTEILLATVFKAKADNGGSDIGDEVERVGQHAIAHLLSSVTVGGVCFVIFMRLHEELGNFPLDQGFLVLNLFLSLVSFVMLAGDYAVTPDLQHTSLLQTHKFTYAMVMLMAITSYLTWIRKEAGAFHTSITNKRKDLVDAQFILSICSLLLGPMLANFTAAITGGGMADDGKVKLKYNAQQLQPSSSGMSYDRLSTGATKKTDLQFV